MLKTTRPATRTKETEPARHGRIPRSAWPAVVSRHDNGEPLGRIARSYGVNTSVVTSILRRADAVNRPEREGDRSAGADREEAEPAQVAGASRSSPSARLAAAAKRCCVMLDASGPVPAMTEELKTAIHEVRRSLAAIEIAAAQQTRASR